MMEIPKPRNAAVDSACWTLLSPEIGLGVTDAITERREMYQEQGHIMLSDKFLLLPTPGNSSAAVAVHRFQVVQKQIKS